IDPCLRIPAAVRRHRARAGRYEPTVRIGRVDSDRPGVVAVAAVVGRGPGLAGVLAPGGTAAARPGGAPFGVRMPGKRVDVALGSWAMVLPALAAVGRAHEPAQLDADEEEVAVVRAGRDPADVGCPRPRRKAPRRSRRKLLQRRQLDP